MWPGRYRFWRESWDCLLCDAILAGINFSRFVLCCENARDLALHPAIRLRKFTYRVLLTASVVLEFPVAVPYHSSYGS
jgi:hypothetical protein